MDLKSKILSILISGCDNEIKTELMDELMMGVSNDYMEWAADRNINILKISGFKGLEEDFEITTEQIWERFKEYHKIKA